MKTVPTRAVESTAERCINEHGFSLHADVRCAAHQRNQLERRCRYITRPAIANERLNRNTAGDVVLELKSPYRDGTALISSCRRWNSDHASPPWCPGRGSI
ncbi:MAG: transposase [Methylococcales bacterium]